jgi:hypothetical protein
MSEAEWLARNDVLELLNFLKGKVNDRKLRLFTVYGCWLQRNLITQRMFDTVVQYVDGLASLKTLRKEWRGTPSWPEQPYEWAHTFVLACREGEMNYPSEAELVPIVHEIFGNPFRPVAVSPEWRTDTALSLARQMYESRDFSAMPILADALQDAGCDSEEILNHCRGPNPHVRGCWVVDLVLGKS